MNSDEKPILMNGAMVRAVIDGRKTQTRRICPVLLPGDRRYIHAGDTSEWRQKRSIQCPFGVPGTQLWVRETFMAESRATIHYKADGWGYSDCPNSGWKPSIHMPRWASRITLQVTGVRVDRLQDISEEDAKAEAFNAGVLTVQAEFSLLWSSIYGVDSWNANPWVWVIDFQRLPR